MVALAQHSRHFTPEEYLTLERAADYKSEYYHGEIYAMSGSSLEHSIITINIAGEVREQLKGKPCQAVSSDTKIRTSPEGLYAYPDLTVICGEPHFHDEHRDVVTNPTVIFEVLSPSTEAYDRGRKFSAYQSIAALTDYVLIAQDESRIEHYVRQGNDQWLLSVARGLDASVHLTSIDCTLELAEVYDRVTFPERGPRRRE